MIQSFRHKGLSELFAKGRSARVPAQLLRRCANLLEVLDGAEQLSDLTGFSTHPLHTKPERYAMSVSGQWRITFEWDAPHTYRVDLEQYH